MIGYDAYSDPAHRSAMDRARDTNTVEFTRMDYVLTGMPSHSKADVVRRKGFVVYLPVYQEDEPAGTVAERRRALRGFVVGTFRSDELFARAFVKSFNPAIDVEVYDGEDVASSSLLYDKNRTSNAREEDAAFTKESKISMGGDANGAYISPRCRSSRKRPRATYPPSCSRAVSP